jgi:hypothetical protein
MKAPENRGGLSRTRPGHHLPPLDAAVFDKGVGIA